MENICGQQRANHLREPNREHMRRHLPLNDAMLIEDMQICYGNTSRARNRIHTCVQICRTRISRFRRRLAKI